MNTSTSDIINDFIAKNMNNKNEDIFITVNDKNGNILWTIAEEKKEKW